MASSISSLHWKVSTFTSSSDDDIANWSEDDSIDYFEDLNNAKNLPEELLLKIFSYMLPKDIAQVRSVCKLWKRIGSSSSLKISFLTTSFKEYLHVKYPKLPVTVIDEFDWREHVDLEQFELSVDDSPVLNYITTIKKLMKLSTLPIESNAGGTLLLKPKGISLNKIIEIAAIKRQYCPELEISFSAHLIDGSIEKSCWVWVANSIMKDSRDKTPDDQEQILTEIGCEMPSVLDITMLAVLKLIMSNGRESIFNWNGKTYFDLNPTYTYCSDDISRRVVVGGSPLDSCLFISVLYRYSLNEMTYPYCSAMYRYSLNEKTYSYIPSKAYIGVSPSMKF